MSSNSKNLASEISREYDRHHEASFPSGRVVEAGGTPFQNLPPGAPSHWPEHEDGAPPDCDPLLAPEGRRWLDDAIGLSAWAAVMAGLWLCLELIARCYE